MGMMRGTGDQTSGGAGGDSLLGGVASSAHWTAKVKQNCIEFRTINQWQALKTISEKERKQVSAALAKPDKAAIYQDLVKEGTTESVQEFLDQILDNQERIDIATISGPCDNPEIANRLLNSVRKHFQYDVNDPDFHNYCHATLICDLKERKKCTVDTVYKLLKRFPAPQLDNFGEASDGGTSVLNVGDVTHTVDETEKLVN